MIKKRKLNVDVINHVIKAIETNENDWGFDMSLFVNLNGSDEQISETEFFNGKKLKPNCGTTMCIAGWACALYPRRGLLDHFYTEEGYDIEERAAYILGLDKWDAKDLFYATGSLKKKQKALRCLRLIAKGANVNDAIKWAQRKDSYERNMKKLAAVV